MSKTIAIDFDGVLHSYKSGWIAADILEEPLDGALDFCNWLIENKFKIVIFSCRAGQPIGWAAIHDWLEKHRFPPSIEVTHKKPEALLYIDDRGMRFDGNFDTVVQFITNNPGLKTWQKLK